MLDLTLHCPGASRTMHPNCLCSICELFFIIENIRNDDEILFVKSRKKMLGITYDECKSSKYFPKGDVPLLEFFEIEFPFEFICPFIIVFML